MNRGGQGRVAEIERRSLHNEAVLIDDQAEPPMRREEGEAMTAKISVDAALDHAGDTASLHFLAEQRQCHAKPFGDDGGIDLDGIILEFDFCHVVAVSFRVGAG